jgi:2-polyprenyl-6-methoxyphenol hydroxylase-like FAD-dependent oxidoreductase
VAPHSGQVALEDAMFLAKLLRETNGASLERVFTSFEQQRRPRTDKVIALGRRNAQRKRKKSPFAYWFQQQMIHLFFPLPAKKQDWLLGYKVE